MQKRKNNAAIPEIKFFITTLSLTAIVAFWNLFAKQALEAQAIDSSNSDSPDNQIFENLSQETLPTLVPLRVNQAQQVTTNINEDPVSIADLQEVEAPIPVVSEANQPIVVDSINLAQPVQAQTDPQNQPNQPAAQAQPTVAATTSSSK